MRVAYAVLYPNRHAVGMANLGLQTVVGVLDALPGALCHRAFADHPRTLEANRELRDYHVVAISLAYEGDYPAALALLQRAGVPLHSGARDASHPLVLIGGVAPSLNPEPLAPFADAVFLGEAEAGLPHLHPFLSAHREQPRPQLLQRLAEARLPGIYVPSRYRVEEGPEGGPQRSTLGAAPARIARTWAQLPFAPARTRIRAPDDAFDGTYLLEIGRGCPHACRFCATGYLTRPVRFHPAAALLPHIERGVAAAGKVGLVSAAVSNHPELEDLFRAVLARGGQFTVSSFRAESLTAERLELLLRGGLKTLTVAVEAGTAALRNALGKNLSAEQVIAGAQLAGAAGLDNLRVYAMVGLPGEQDADVDALAELCIRAREAMGRGTLTLSVAPFVPKPHTPLQWSVMAPEKVLRARIRRLERTLRQRRGLHAVAEAPKWSRVQGFLSRGGRGAASLLEQASGDGDWRRVLRSATAKRVLDREWGAEESLPWDFIDGVPGKAHLLQERGQTHEPRPPTPCRPGSCRLCGVCGSDTASAQR